jgi:hypothetical protein
LPSLLSPPRRYLEGKAQLLYPEPKDVFPKELIERGERQVPYFGSE